MRTALVLALPVVACMIACGGGPPAKPRLTDKEAVGRLERLMQPTIPGGTAVTLDSREEAMKGRFVAYLGDKPGENRVELPNGTTASVILDNGNDGLFLTQVMITSGQHVNRGAWVSRGDIHR